MKKLKILLFTILFFIPIFVFGSEKDLNLYFFYGDGCPHCAALDKYFDEYLKDKEYIHVYKYEVWNNRENQEKYKKVHEILKTGGNGIPFLVIGETSITGFDEEYTPEKIENAIKYYSKVKFNDKVGVYLGLVDEKEIDNSKLDNNHYVDEEVSIPIIGKKKAKDVPILLSTVIIGLVDGFNPCAMWILIFLISMLLGIKSKKRRWALGITFLSTSAIVYFLFLLSWIELSGFLHTTAYIRLGISFVAIMFGTYAILTFFKNLKKDDACEVVDTKRRRKIIRSIQKIVKEKSFPLALLGIALLALAVNVIELLCSLGLPVMYSEILIINEVPLVSKILYSLIYVFFFLIDDIIVFIIAMKTLEIKVISNKFGKYSHLIGGIIMLIIGILMIVKPAYLMFNF